MNDLFRKEAGDYSRRRLHGPVVLAIPIATGTLSALLVLILSVGFVFLAMTSFARKETVSGWLTPSEGLIRLSASQGGVVADLPVFEGQKVVAGQTIATLTLSPSLEGGDSYAALTQGFQTLNAAARVRASSALASLEAEQQQLRTRRAAIDRELVEARLRKNLQDQQVELSRAELSRAESIAAQGFLPRSQVESRQAMLLSAEGEASDLRGQILAYEREIGEINARLSAIPIDIRTVRAESDSAHAALDQQATQAEAQSKYRVVASVGGLVAALPLGRGQTAQPGATVAILTAGESPLEAELYVPSRSAGFIREGQVVRLMYQAFPHQKFGVGEGEVTSVSRTVLAPSEVSVLGLQIQEPVFRVRVKLKSGTVSAYGETVPLQPGMLLSADVVIDRRSLLEWLLDPIFAAGRRT